MLRDDVFFTNYIMIKTLIKLVFFIQGENTNLVGIFTSIKFHSKLQVFARTEE